LKLLVFTICLCQHVHVAVLNKADKTFEVLEAGRVCVDLERVFSNDEERVLEVIGARRSMNVRTGGAEYKPV